MPVAALAKKAVFILIAAFAVFYLLVQPTAAADLVQTVIGGIGDAFEQLMSFFTALAS